MDGGRPRGRFDIGLLYGSRRRESSSGHRLTMHTALMNVLPRLAPTHRPLALYYGLSAVARACAGQPPRSPIQALPEGEAALPTPKRRFRRFMAL